MKINTINSNAEPATGLMAHLKIRLALAKAPKSFLISASSLFTFIIKMPDINYSLILTGFSVFALACGAATFNNYQDRHLDLQMQRTRGRPLPSKKISAAQTIGQVILLIFLGQAGLYLVDTSPALPLLGTAAIVSYNFIYTPLKTKSMLAIIPGAVCGMLPPCIGWLAAGGRIDSITLWSIMLIFGLWQLPHFWLILLLYPQDYMRSKVPNMLSLFSVDQLRKVLFNWVVVFSIMTFALPLSNVIVTDLALWFVFLNALYLVCNFAYHFFLKTESYNYKYLLVHLNASLIFVMCLGMLDHLILHYSRFS